MKARVLAIAGSDPSGGAGIQADLKTYSAFGVYGMTAITALTVQNTQGVGRIVMVDADVVREQIASVVEDIGVDAIKVGMLGQKSIIHAVSEELRRLDLAVPIVVDPVMRAKGGDRLLDEEAETLFYNEIIPLATVLTPNLPEVETLVKFPVKDRVGMLQAAKALRHQGVPIVLVKGGHLAKGAANDLLSYEDQEVWLSRRRILTRHTHGTGCTLSSAIAAGLALGKDIEDAVIQAKSYVSRAIETAPGLGHGHGPLWHGGSISGVRWEPCDVGNPGGKP